MFENHWITWKTHTLAVHSYGPTDGSLDQFFPLEGGHDVLVNTTLLLACGVLVKSHTLKTLNG